MEKKSLASQLQGVLKECPHVRGYQLSVLELSESVVIGGTVKCYYHKQMAQESIRIYLKTQPGLTVTMTLTNNIVVRSSPARTETE